MAATAKDEYIDAINRDLEKETIHAKRQAEKAAVFGTLEAKTVALRDAGIAYKRAQEEYRAALEAFNRHVAPEPG